MKTVYTCFPGGKFKCLTMSYDDGKLADRRLVEIFNRHGIRGTFHLNSGRMDSDPARIPSSEYPTLYAGHEVACHTVTHPTIARCPVPSVVTQVMEDRAALEKVMGYPVQGLSYPNGSHSEDIRRMPAGGPDALAGHLPSQSSADGAGPGVLRAGEKAVSVPDVRLGPQL